MSEVASISSAPAADVAAADRRIAVIDDSLKCLLYGALSCVPFLGAGCLLSAVRSYRRAAQNPTPWNPARRPLAAGLALASVGWLVTLASWWFPVCEFVVADYFDQWVTTADLFAWLPRILALGFPLTLVGWTLAIRSLRPLRETPVRSFRRKPAS